MDTDFPISLAEAGRRLKKTRTWASIVAKAIDLPVSRSPIHPTARMVNREAFETLKAQAMKFDRAERLAV